MMKYIKTCAFLFLVSCSWFKKDKIISVDNFVLDKYLGTWYEIARTDNEFEKECIGNVSANYTVRKDKGVDVLNQCQTKNGYYKVAKGRAYFKEQPTIGKLKVTFFWPFYGDYNVVYIDKDYKNAIVYGGDDEYVWILSRTKEIKKEKLEELKTELELRNFDLNRLLFTKQDN